MNNKILLTATVCLLTLNRVFAQNTQFTYQGELNTNATPYSGSAEILFTLWDASTNGSAIATNNAGSIITTVNNGLFTVSLDFGNSPFTGDSRFLQAEVRTAIGPFTALAPRQPLTAAPYALRALSLTTNGLVSGTYGNTLTLNNAANVFSGSFIGNGSTISNINALTLGGVSSSGFWATNGNAGANPTNGAFLGTRDNLPLELKVNGFRAFRIDPASNGAPNIIAGSPRNFVATNIVGATIGGGGSTNYFGSALTNFVQADFGTVGGGVGNQIGILGQDGTIGGGIENTLSGTYGVISGGFGNILTTNTFGSAIGGGIGNEIDGGYNALQGGENSSTIAGGADNQIGVPPFIPSSYFEYGYNSIGGGGGNHIYAQVKFSTIAGGVNNLIETNANQSTIGGGTANDIGMNSTNSVISGGNNNSILTNSSFATIPGGDSNTATNYAFAAGRRAQAVNQGAFVWADSQNANFASTAANQFLIRAAGGVGIGTASPTRELEVQHAADVEIGVKSTDTGGHLWTLQSSAVTGSANLDASFQIVDRTLNSSRLFIGTNGNIGIGTGNPTNKLHVIGGITCTALVQTSDRNAKENFSSISPDEILAKVAALPISSWTYKEMRDGRHLGPMAQDFYAAFQLGGSDTTITAIDTEGVALAAIQGLNQKLQQELKTKDGEIADLKTRLEKLESLMANVTGEPR